MACGSCGLSDELTASWTPKNIENIWVVVFVVVDKSRVYNYFDLLHLLTACWSFAASNNAMIFW